MVRSMGILLMAMALALPPVGAARAGHLAVGDVYRQSRDAIVEVRKTDNFGRAFRGTGFFIAPQIIATNFHTVNDARQIFVRDPQSGKLYTVARIVAVDPLADTALLEVRERSRHYLPIEDVAAVRIGDPILVIGNMQGYTASLSQGIVSGIRDRDGSTIYQISANVSGGSSGSPLLNDHGRVIGIVYGRFRTEAQIGFATPAANLSALADGRWPPKPDPQPLAKSRSLAPTVEIDNTTASRRTAGGGLKTIQIGLPNADSAIATGYALQALIEQLLDLPVELVPSTHEIIFNDLASPDGIIDIHPDVWLPNHRRFMAKGIRLNKTSYGAIQGICVPRYVLTNFSVGRLSDLAGAAIARLFDTDRDGKGEIWIGPDGWESTEINRLKARDHGFAPAFTLETYPEAEAYKRLAAAVSARRPFVFHCYGPHWMFRKYELVRLAEPAHGEDCFYLSDRRGADERFRDSRAACSEPASRIHVAHAGRLVWQQPRLAALLEHVTFTYEEINELIFDMVGSRAQKARVARKWAREALARYHSLDGLVSGEGATLPASAPND